MGGARSESSFSEGRIDVFQAPPSKPSHLWTRWMLWIFGPREVSALELEEQRLSHGLRKIVMLVAAVLFAAAVWAVFWYGVFEHGYPTGELVCCPYAWFAYYGRVGAAVLVMILCLRGMVKLAMKDKSQDKDQLPMDVAKRLLAEATSA